MKLDCNSSKWIPPTQSCHIRSLLSAHPPHPQHTHTPIRVCAVNNKSCVTSQITQTAYHLFIVVYHNNSSVRTKATASQTRAFVNELGRLPDLKINWQCCWFLSLRVCLALSYLPTRDKIETVLRKYRISLRWSVSVQLDYTVVSCWSPGKTTDW